MKREGFAATAEDSLHTLHSSIQSINLYSFHSFIYSNRSKEKVLREPYLDVVAVEQRRW
jgi:hypothetical protein